MMTKMKTASVPADPDGGATTEEEKSPGSKTSYECRFCLMKFEKSQALGGHMNRHRQEREKEQYQQAQHLLNSLAQQQMPRNWTSLITEIPQLPSDPGALSRMTSQFTRPYAPPPISFGSYRGQAPTSSSNPSSSNPSLQSSLSSSNYYVPSNSSNCNNNLQQLLLQQQSQHWGADCYSTAAAARSAPQAASFRAETTISARVVPQEVFASMLRASATNNHNINNINNHNNNDNSSMVSSGTPTNTLYDMYPLPPFM